MPTMEKGDILGHEPMGEVVEVGPAVTNLSRRSRRGAVHHFVRRMLFLPQGTLFVLRQFESEFGGRPKDDGAHPRRAFSAIRILPADLPADRPNISACRLPMSDRLKFRMECRMKRYCFFPIFSRQDTWRRKMPRSKKAIP